jgi:hypothetical protein
LVLVLAYASVPVLRRQPLDAAAADDVFPKPGRYSGPQAHLIFAM